MDKYGGGTSSPLGSSSLDHFWEQGWLDADHPPCSLPRQVLTGKYDAKCDLWSCGIIMYVPNLSREGDVVKGGMAGMGDGAGKIEVNPLHHG